MVSGVVVRPVIPAFGRQRAGGSVNRTSWKPASESIRQGTEQLEGKTCNFSSGSSEGGDQKPQPRSLEAPLTASEIHRSLKPPVSIEDDLTATPPTGRLGLRNTLQVRPERQHSLNKGQPRTDRVPLASSRPCGRMSKALGPSGGLGDEDN